MASIHYDPDASFTTIPMRTRSACTDFLYPIDAVIYIYTCADVKIRARAGAGMGWTLRGGDVMRRGRVGRGRRLCGPAGPGAWAGVRAEPGVWIPGSGCGGDALRGDGDTDSVSDAMLMFMLLLSTLATALGWH